MNIQYSYNNPNHTDVHNVGTINNQETLNFISQFKDLNSTLSIMISDNDILHFSILTKHIHSIELNQKNVLTYP